MHEVLRQWGDLGRRLSHAQRQTPSWEPVQRIATAAIAFFAHERERVKELLKQSDAKLAPLTDPLSLAFDLHRWLAADREEAYSDWLAWAVQQLTDPRDVFALFGVTPPDEFEWPTDAPDVTREYPVPEGHADRSGRLDLVVQYESWPPIVIEVKLGSADDADTAKNEGYSLWSKDRGGSTNERVLLATDAEEPEYGGFRFLSWEHICQQFRRLSLSHIQAKRVSVAALTLAFVAAVEQNLLGLRAPTDSAFVNPRLSPYLSEWLQEGTQ